MLLAKAWFTKRSSGVSHPEQREGSDESNEIPCRPFIYESFVKGGHSQFFSRKKVTGNTSACRPYF